MAKKYSFVMTEIINAERRKQGREEKEHRLTLRIPEHFLMGIDKSINDSIVKVSRNHWILRAIEEALETK